MLNLPPESSLPKENPVASTTPQPPKAPFTRWENADISMRFGLSFTRKLNFYQRKRLFLKPPGKVEKLENSGCDSLLERIVLEQFVEGLSAATADWVLCHRPADLAGAITLAEDHLAVLSRGRAPEGRPAYPGGLTPTLRRGPGSGPPPPHHTPARPSPRPRTGYNNNRPSPLPRTNPPGPFFPPQGPAATGAALDLQRAPQAAGQECWRCGQLGHFRGECPLMEVGQVIRVVGPPAPSPGPGGTYSVPVRIKGVHIRRWWTQAACSLSFIRT